MNRRKCIYENAVELLSIWGFNSDRNRKILESSGSAINFPRPEGDGI